jgi:cephalosporin-C deacetylase-like acetyl esterase
MRLPLVASEDANWSSCRRLCLRAVVLLLGCSFALASLNPLQADPTRVLPEGKQPNDRRLLPLKDLDGYFPFTVPASKEAWDARAEEVRRRLLVSLGLWPMPAKTPLNAVVHGKVDREDFTVEKVYFESFPGFYVTGSLFRPKGKSGKLPVVLCPHGHWPNGRFFDHGAQKGLEEIAAGAERFEESGRYPLQARCVQLARMGCVVFHYDMIGYADSAQLSFELAHRFGKQRPALDNPDSFGFFSTQAELRLQSIMGLQTLNSIRALDWVTTLDDVDPTRIAVTGASGGGTQTFILAAIDPRVTVAFPAVMVSTAMQGGCTCENASLLRVGTGNIEIAGLFAPKPLAMTTANDWTREIMTKGLPELQGLYKLLGAPDNVGATPLVHFPHNYNAVSRMAMYKWLNKHLQIGLPEPVIEKDFKPLSQAELTVWDAEHPRPTGGDAYEISATKELSKLSDEQLAALTPKDAASLEKYREVMLPALDILIDRKLSPANTIAREKIDKQDHGDYWFFKDLLRYTPGGEELPTVFLHPKKWNGHVVLWFDGAGKSALLDTSGSPQVAIKRLLAEGVAVASADLFGQGEFLADGKPLTETAVVANPREVAAYTDGYNDTVFARRVQDILTLASFVIVDEHNPKRISIVGVNGAGPLVAAAKAIAGKSISDAVIDTQGFRFTSLSSYRDPNFLPGAVKYGDVPGLLSLAAPSPLVLVGEGSKVPAIVAATYRVAGAADAVKASTLKQAAEDQAADFLLKK